MGATESSCSALLLALLVLGCDSHRELPVATDGGAQAAEEGSAAPAVDSKEDARQDTAATDRPKEATKPASDPSLQPYPALAKPISANCRKPHVLMATVPESVGSRYSWPWTRQAMLANQQFTVIDDAPRHPGQVSFELHRASKRHNNVWILVAKCKDGGTCNDLAAMYKATIEGAMAQPVCGRLPLALGPATYQRPALGEAGLSTHTLPGRNDVLGACARLQACSVAMDPVARAGKETIGFDCQKAPSRFELDCARRYPCRQVVKCVSK